MLEFPPRTLYSYFETKNDLLLAVIVSDFELGFELGSKIIGAADEDALNAVNAMSSCHFAVREGGLTAEMWRYAIAAFLSCPDSHFAREYENRLNKVRTQFTLLVETLQANGLLPASLAPDELAHILESSATQLFLDFIRSQTLPVESLSSNINRMNACIVNMARNC